MNFLNLLYGKSEQWKVQQNKFLINYSFFSNCRLRIEFLFQKTKAPKLKEIFALLLDNLHELPKAYAEAGEYLWIFSQKPKSEIGSTLSKVFLLGLCYKGIGEHSNTQIVLYFCHEQNNNTVSNMKILDTHDEQLTIVATANLHYHKFNCLNVNCYLYG